MRIDEIQLKALDRVSPSQYSSLRKCAMRVVLGKSLAHPLLPYPPHSHLGNVIHECIRLILSKQVRDYESFNELWQSLMEKEEAKLDSMGFNSMIPIKDAVKKGYSIKKLQVKSLIKRCEEGERNLGPFPISFLHEKWLCSTDGLIGGKADMITEFPNKIRITDFKSGRVLDHVGCLNEDYELQLKLYAYLYFEETGRYPDQLALVDLERKEYLLSFTSVECQQIAEVARDRLIKVNEDVYHNNIEGLVNPCVEHCSYCLYRPACNCHWSVLNEASDNRIFDISGKLKGVKAFLNGTLSIILEVDGKETIVSQVDKSFEEALIDKVGSKIAIFNIFASEIQNRYKMIKNTMIYDSE